MTHREGGWQPIETAPKDGTQVQLLWPYPRGHSVGWQWSNEGIYVNGPHDGGYWFRRRPTWSDTEIGKLLPEEDWNVETRPGSKPTQWMPLPPPPSTQDRSNEE